MPAIGSRLARVALTLGLLTAPFPGRAGVEEAAGPCTPPCSQRVFLVQRSLNENELVYEANLTPTGFHKQVPLFAYWVMKARDGHREELTSLERSKAYGLKFASVEDRTVVFSVKALEGLPLRAELTEEPDGSWRVHAVATVDGKDVPFEKVFISTRNGGGLVPKVDHIELSGVQAGTHEPLVRRLDPAELKAAASLAKEARDAAAKEPSNERDPRSGK